MKKILYILVLFAANIHAQTFKMPADTEFIYTYGGTNFDEAHDIKETPDKGYILVGTTSSFGQGATSVYMIKTDSMGNHKWSSVQGGPQNDWAYAIETTHDSGFFVAGYSNSFYTSNSFDYSAYYFKTDKNGNLLWQKFVDNGANSFIYGACPVTDSGFILCGQTYATTSGNADGYLIRVNKNGDTLWTNHYGGVQDEVFNSVCVINNRIYAVGSNGSHAGADSLADGWIVKLNMNGDTLKNTYVSYGAHQQETLNGITLYNDSLFTVCGNETHIDSNITTGIITRYDTSLNINLDITHLNNLNNLSNNPSTFYNKVVNISYGNICVIGSKLGGAGGLGMFFVGFNIQLSNAFPGYNISYTTGDGFYPTDGGTQDDNGYSGIYTSTGRVIGIGNTKSTQEYCTTSNLGLQDVFLIRYNSDSIHTQGVIPEYTCYADTLSLSQASIKNYTTNNFKVNLFPNPVYSSAQLDIKCNAENTYTAKIFSVLGNEVMGLKVYSNQSNSLDLSGISEGTYFLKIQDDFGNTISVIKFISVH